MPSTRLGRVRCSAIATVPPRATAYSPFPRREGGWGVRPILTIVATSPGSRDDLFPLPTSSWGVRPDITILATSPGLRDDLLPLPASGRGLGG